MRWAENLHDGLGLFTRGHVSKNLWDVILCIVHAIVLFVHVFEQNLILTKNNNNNNNNYA